MLKRLRVLLVAAEWMAVTFIHVGPEGICSYQRRQMTSSVKKTRV